MKPVGCQQQVVGRALPADSASSAEAPPVHLEAERLYDRSWAEVCASQPTDALASWAVPSHWALPDGEDGAPPTGPHETSFGVLLCEIRTHGVILQLEILDLTQNDGIIWPPRPTGPENRGR
jgi:hypothetical protein